MLRRRLGTTLRKSGLSIKMAFLWVSEVIEFIKHSYYDLNQVTIVHFVWIATQLKTEVGSLPEGKVKIRLEYDGTLLEVDEDDVEKVSGVTNHMDLTHAKHKPV